MIDESNLGKCYRCHILLDDSNYGGYINFIVKGNPKDLKFCVDCFEKEFDEDD